MKVDISGLSSKELEQLSAKIDARKAALEQETLHQALEDMQAVAAKHGLAFGDVIRRYSGAPAKTAKATKAKGEPKYQDPADPSRTWSGKGRKPAWIVEGLEAGKSLEDFAI